MSKTTPFSGRLLPFCAVKNNLRYAIVAPWIVNGKRYATDGAILACEPNGGANTIAPDGLRFPDTAEVMEGWCDCMEPLPALIFTGLNKSKCRACHGSNYQKKKCPECGVDHNCQSLSCPYCDKHGYEYVMRIYDDDFLLWYLGKIAGLNGVKIAPQLGPDGRLFFKARGGLRGVLLPLEKDRVIEPIPRTIITPLEEDK